MFGGLANMTQALSNIFTIYNPKIVAVHTTCLSEVIGDDIPMMIKKATEKKASFRRANGSFMRTRRASSVRTSPVLPARSPRW